MQGRSAVYILLWRLAILVQYLPQTCEMKRADRAAKVKERGNMEMEVIGPRGSTMKRNEACFASTNPHAGAILHQRTFGTMLDSHERGSKLHMVQSRHLFLVLLPSHFDLKFDLRACISTPWNERAREYDKRIWCMTNAERLARNTSHVLHHSCSWPKQMEL